MLKKLTAKVQQLNPVLEESVAGFANSLVIEPETQELQLKKGSLYVVFDISGNTRFDPPLITKVVHDMLHDAYFQSDSISPIQSLEKAITDVRDKVTQLANESIIIEQQEVEFNIVAGALWGNVMYVVQYGTSKSYLMRTGDIRPLSTTSEGNFSAASGVVKDEDVIIFSSKSFTDDFPPDKLLTVAIPESSLQPKQACLLMKFIIDTTFTQNEVVDFGIEGVKIKKPTPPLIAGLTSKFFVKRERKPKKDPPIRELGVKLSSPKKTKIKPQYAIPVVLIALGISIFFTLKNNKKEPQGQTKNTEQVIVETPTQEQAPVVEEVPDANAFYDMKIKDPNTKPSAIAVFNDFVVVTDKSAGKIYLSDRTIPKFTEIEATFPGIDNVINIQGYLGFTDNTGYKTLKLSDKSIADTFASTQLGITNAYSDFVYTIKGDTLTRYAKEDTSYKGTTWAQTPELAEVKSFGISFSIFMLKNNGEVVKYTSGEKDTFTLSEQVGTLNNPVQILADVDFDSVYLADAGNKRVVAVDKGGKFVQEYKAKEGSQWDSIISIAVSPDEKVLYVLNGTRIYEVTL